MADSVAVGAATTHHANVYAQHMLPQSSTLVALFHAQTASRHERVNLRRKPPPTPSCLRKISAYNGGFRIVDVDDEAARTEATYEQSTGAVASRYTKKRLSFADQHGGQLVLEREFHARDAPIYCNNAITYSLPSLLANRDDSSGWRSGSRAVVERLLRGALSSGGRGSKEQKSGWSQPELLSLCVLSCSVVGCVVFSYARAMASK